MYSLGEGVPGAKVLWYAFFLFGDGGGVRDVSVAS